MLGLPFVKLAGICSGSLGRETKDGYRVTLGDLERIAQDEV